MPEAEREPHVERFEERVQRLLDEGHSVPAIAGRLHRERGYTCLADLIGAINRIKHQQGGSSDRAAERSSETNAEAGGA